MKTTHSTLAGTFGALLCRGGLTLLAVLCLFIFPTSAKAACGSFGATGIKNSIKLPMVAQAELTLPLASEGTNPAIVGLWHVIYTAADQSLFKIGRAHV